MRSYTNPYPIHDLVFKHYPDKQAALKTLSILMNNSRTTLASKLHLLGRLLKGVMVGKAEIVAVVASIQKENKADILSEIQKLDFEQPEILDELISFLIKEKFFNRTLIQKIYEGIDSYASKRGDLDAREYFIKRILSLPVLTRADKHRNLCNYSFLLLSMKDEREAIVQMKAAREMETKGMVAPQHLHITSVLNYFVDSFDRAMTFHFKNQDMFRMIAVVNEALPEDPVLIKKAKELIQYYLSRPEQHFDERLLACLLMLPQGMLALYPIYKEAVAFVQQQLAQQPEEVQNRLRQVIADGEKNINGNYPPHKPLFVTRKSKSVRSYLVILEKAIMMTKENKLLEALELTSKTLQEASTHLAADEKNELLPVYIFYVENAIEAGSYLKAIDACEEALKIAPEKKRLLELYHSCFDKLGEYKKQKDVLQKMKNLGYIDKDEEKFGPTAFNKLYSKLNPVKQDASSSASLSNDISSFQSGHNSYQTNMSQALNTPHLSIVENLSDIMEIIFGTSKSISNQFTSAGLKIRLGQFQEAINVLEEVAPKRDPMLSAPQLMLCYSQLGQYDKAMEQAESLLQNLLPRYQFGRSNRLHAIRCIALCFQERAMLREGAEYFSTLLSNATFIPDEQDEIHFHLASFHYALASYRLAEDYAFQALRHHGKNVSLETYWILGYSQLNNNKTTQALNIFSSSTKAYPQNALAYLHLGYCSYNMTVSLNERAKKNFNNALDLDPTLIITLSEVLPSADVDALLEVKDEAPLSDSVAETKEESNLEMERVEIQSFSLSQATVMTDPFIYFSPEQLFHKIKQAQKKRLSSDHQNSDVGDSKQDDTNSFWELPNLKLYKQDSRVYQIHMLNHRKEYSHLYAFLDRSKLEASCSTDLLGRWEALLDLGKIVGAKGQAGIRLINAQKSAKLPENLKNHKAELKLVGFFGDYRAYGRIIESENERDKLICFDEVEMHSHKTLERN